MSPDEQEASDLIRQGRYFDHARQWYTALYIGPISERSVFLALGILAGLIGIFGFFAFIGLIPVTERPPLMINNPKMDDTVPHIERLRAGDMSINEALRRYHVMQYVLSRESYVAADFGKNSRYVATHSDPATASAYLAAAGPENPRNPAALLGEHGTRIVTIQSVDIDEGEPNTAAVRFSTELGGTAPASKTQWTATIQFHYSDAVVSEAENPQSGETVATLQEPQFQVISYVLSQS